MTYRFYPEFEAKSIIGAVLKNPDLLESDEAQSLDAKDFPDPLHRLVYFSINNLYETGHSEITGELIDSYLSSRPKMMKIFQDGNGYDFVNECYEKGIESSFVANVNRFKKLSLLRNLENLGVSVRGILDWDTPDKALFQAQMEMIDSSTVEEIGSIIGDKIDEEIERASSTGPSSDKGHGGRGVMETIESLKKSPDFGSPLHDPILNTAIRGARLGTFILRSCPTGGGKTRGMVGDMLTIACPKYIMNDEWVVNEAPENALFITTELDFEEIQTMALGFVSDINEEKILNYDLTEEEESRLLEAGEVLEESNYWVEHIPDFSITEVERIIRRNIRENDVKYVYFDYIHTSMTFLQEISSISSGMKLREDQILFMLSSKLKDLASKLGIFIQSATQVSGDWKNEMFLDQRFIRGSRAVADRVDAGFIALRTRPVDEAAIEGFVQAGYPRPNYVVHIYKLRRGSLSNTKIWCHADLGTSKIRGLFVTNDMDEPIDHVTGTVVRVKRSAF